jgi:hypothetical protein
MASNDASATAADSKHTVLTIPTEIVELIALFLEPEDLIKFRLSNYEIATKTFQAFIDKFVKDLTFIFQYGFGSAGQFVQNAPNKMAELKDWPQFAHRVQSLTLRYMDLKPGMDKQMPTHVGLLNNLRSLCLSWVSVEYNSHSYCPERFLKLPMPHLEIFEIDHGMGIKAHCLSDLISNHRKTFKSVQLLSVCVDDREGTGEWDKILEDLKSLCSDATVVISRPFAYLNLDESLFPDMPEDRYYDHRLGVSFTPTEDDEDANAVRVVKGRLDGLKKETKGLHYFSQPGHLQRALSCMQRNYKELIKRSERDTAGAGWYSSDEEGSEEEGSDDDSNICDEVSDEGEVDEDEDEIEYEDIFQGTIINLTGSD